MPIGGMMTSFTNEDTIFPKAPPMIMPTAMSTTLPRIAKDLNSCIIPIFSSPRVVLGSQPARPHRPLAMMAGRLYPPTYNTWGSGVRSKCSQECGRIITSFEGLHEGRADHDSRHMPADLADLVGAPDA